MTFFVPDQIIYAANARKYKEFTDIGMFSLSYT